MSSDEKEKLFNELQDRLTLRDTALVPALPPKIAIEINNSCNHRCYFCPNPIMERQRAVMGDEMLFRIMGEASEAGIRELSFYSTGEPFLHKQLPRFVGKAKEMGFNYVFLSTNGGSAVSGKILPVLDAGLDSLKFSINAGDRETYMKTHGRDDFDEVMRNLESVAEYRAKAGRRIKLFVSFVETQYNKHSFASLKERVAPLVDEVLCYPFVVIGTPLKPGNDKSPDLPQVGYADVDTTQSLNQLRFELPCYQLWNYLNVSLEGYLLACCSDFNNDLVVGNLRQTSLLQAWHSPEFQAFRQRHLNHDIANTLCEACVKQKMVPFQPINTHLMD